MNPTYIKLWHNDHGAVAYIETTAPNGLVYQVVDKYMATKVEGDELDPSEVVEMLNELGEQSRFIEFDEIEFDTRRKQ